MHYAAIKEAAKVENVRDRGVKLSLTAVRQNPLHKKKPSGRKLENTFCYYLSSDITNCLVVIYAPQLGEEAKGKTLLV